jgi:hypothetical protein
MTSPAEAAVMEARGEDRIDRLIERLPLSIRAAIRWLRWPSSRWARIPIGSLLIVGGVLSILPVLGLWMLPLGAILLADDVPALRRGRDRMLDAIERHRPHWFANTGIGAGGLRLLPQPRPADQRTAGE